MTKKGEEDYMLIDGVFSGGGMKGFALVGAYQVLEEKGYQFKRIAGTSAGAILACFHCCWIYRKGNGESIR